MPRDGAPRDSAPRDGASRDGGQRGRSGRHGAGNGAGRGPGRRDRDGRPRPTFTPREGYEPPPDGRRREDYPAAQTTFLPPVPAGYPQQSYTQPFAYPEAAATAACRARPGRTSGRHRTTRDSAPASSRCRRRATTWAPGRRRSSPRRTWPGRAGDGARHARVPGHRVPAHVRARGRARHRGARRRVQQLQHAAEHRVLPHARRHLHLGRGPDAGPGGQGGPGPGRGVRGADLHPRRDLAAHHHRGGHRAAPGRWSTCTPGTSPIPGRAPRSC